MKCQLQTLTGGCRRRGSGVDYGRASSYAGVSVGNISGTTDSFISLPYHQWNDTNQSLPTDHTLHMVKGGIAGLGVTVVETGRQLH